MAHDLRFQTIIIPNSSWNNFLSKFIHAEELGFDLAGSGDHFVDWTNPPSPWYELWTTLAAVATQTTTLRISSIVAQIPLRNPAMFARQALTLDHISNGRLEIGLGLGLPIDPSYDMMGISNWSNRERMARFPEYVEIVDSLLSNETSNYEGEFYTVNNAIMNPRPIQKPRPPITIAAMGIKMLQAAARYADAWNTMSFAETFAEQLEQTRACIAKMDENCKAISREPDSLRRSYHMFDAAARKSGGLISYYQSENVFVDMVQQMTALGISEFNLYYPTLDEQLPMFEHIAKNVFPQLKAEYRSDL